MAMLKISAVKVETGHLSHTSIYGAIQNGLFIRPVSIGPRSVAWPENEVKAICDARIAGATEEQIRQLVNRLHAKRAELLKTIEGGLYD